MLDNVVCGICVFGDGCNKNALSFTTSLLSLSHSLFDDVVVIIIAVVFFFYIKFLLLQCFLIFFSSPPPYWHVSWTMCVFFLFFFFLFVCILFIGILSSAFFPCKLKKCVCVKSWFFLSWISFKKSSIFKIHIHTDRHVDIHEELCNLIFLNNPHINVHTFINLLIFF